MSSNTINIRDTVCWTVIYFIMCGIFPTTIDKMVWRTFESNISVWFNLLTLIIFSIKKCQLKISVFSNTIVKGILLTIGCSALVLDESKSIIKNQKSICRK